MLGALYVVAFLFFAFPYKATSKEDVLKWILICAIWPVSIVCGAISDIFRFWASLPDTDDDESKK